MAFKVKKTKDGYGYKYADLAEVTKALEDAGIDFYQFTGHEDNGDDYIYTVPIIDGKELSPRRGCKIVNATLTGKSNPAQEQGSAITYARRYSLYMAFGIATEDDDAQCLTKDKTSSKAKKDDAICINATHITTIRKELERTKVDEGEVLKRYNITSLYKLPMECYAGLMKTLTAMEDR